MQKMHFYLAKFADVFEHDFFFAQTLDVLHLDDERLEVLLELPDQQIFLFQLQLVVLAKRLQLESRGQVASGGGRC